MRHVYHLLEAEGEALLERVRAETDAAAKAELIRRKSEVKRALELLRRCEAFDIGPRSVFVRLPRQTLRTPSSHYRIVEDMESDDHRTWREARFAGRPDGRLLLCEGDVVIERVLQDGFAPDAG